MPTPASFPLNLGDPVQFCSRTLQRLSARDEFCVGWLVPEHGGEEWGGFTLWLAGGGAVFIGGAQVPSMLSPARARWQCRGGSDI